ncbi:MAG: sensor domain-containing diguanylate cyclase [Nitrospirota bacterium]|nr:MAG: sensor domain-containing diguanylate cyclase [Nitrospirota bacterium]
MYNVIIIGSDLQFDEKFKTIIAESNINATSFKTISQANKHIKDASAIIITNEMSADKGFGEFIRRTEDIPKLVVMKESPMRGLNKWTRSDLIYPILTPSHKELLFYINKAIADSEIYHKYAELKNDFLIAKNDLVLYEEMNRSLTASLDLDEIIDNFMKLIVDNANAKEWSLYFYDEEEKGLFLEKTHRKSQKRSKNDRLKLGEGIAGWVAQEGHPIIIPDSSRDKRISAKSKKEKVIQNKSIICVPLKSKGDLIGVLEVFNKKKNVPFSKHDLDIIQKIADYASIAIERASLYQKMADLAITDDLTKLFNSRYLNRTIEIELTRCERYNTSVSLIFMDLDYFKEINDQHGHLVGSKVLVELGQLLIKGLRSVDIVSRYGGDEFVIVLPQTSPTVATEIADRLRISINRHIFLKKDGLNLKLTASFGIASYPESAGSKEELLRLADEAMYEVKNRTRDGVYTIKASS